MLCKGVLTHAIDVDLIEMIADLVSVFLQVIGDLIRYGEGDGLGEGVLNAGELARLVGVAMPEVTVDHVLPGWPDGLLVEVVQ